MSVWAKKWAYEQHPKRLNDNRRPTKKKHPAAKAVLVALAEFPGPGQRDCWPSQPTLAAMTDFTDRQVRACLADLEDQGLIKRTVRRRKDGTRRSDMITLLGPEEAFGPPHDPEDQPEDSSGSQAEQSAGSQPEESSGHEPSGNENRQSYEEEEEFVNTHSSSSSSAERKPTDQERIENIKRIREERRLQSV